MVRDEAEKQKQKAKEMLGIDDDRAEEIFQEQPDRKQQKKKELEQKGKLEQSEKQIREDPESVEQQPEETSTDEPEEEEIAETEDEEEEEVELHACPECGDEFDSKRGMNVHKSQVH